MLYCCIAVYYLLARAWPCVRAQARACMRSAAPHFIRQVSPRAELGPVSPD